MNINPYGPLIITASLTHALHEVNESRKSGSGERKYLVIKTSTSFELTRDKSLESSISDIKKLANSLLIYSPNRKINPLAKELKIFIDSHYDEITKISSLSERVLIKSGITFTETIDKQSYDIHTGKMIEESEVSKGRFPTRDVTNFSKIANKSELNEEALTRVFQKDLRELLAVSYSARPGFRDLEIMEYAITGIFHETLSKITTLIEKERITNPQQALLNFEREFIKSVMTYRYLEINPEDTLEAPPPLNFEVIRQFKHYFANQPIVRDILRNFFLQVDFQPEIHSILNTFVQASKGIKENLRPGLAALDTYQYSVASLFGDVLTELLDQVKTEGIDLSPKEAVQEIQRNFKEALIRTTMLPHEYAKDPIFNSTILEMYMKIVESPEFEAIIEQHFISKL